MSKLRFYILCFVTFISVGVLIFALQREAPVFVQEKLGLLLPELNSQLDKVARVEITHGLGLSGTQTLIFSRGAEEGDQLWRVVARDYYPANQELVNETIIALSNLEKLAPRTALKEWHRVLGLTAPDDLSKAIEFKLFDASGAPIAQVLMGNDERSEAEQKQSSKQVGDSLKNFYMRRSDLDQSWLVRGRLPRSKDITPWLDARLVWPDFDQVIEMTLRGISRGSFTRPDAASPWPSNKPVDIMVQIAALRLLDVVSADTIDFADGQTTIFTLANGTEFTISAVTTSSNFWVRLNNGSWAYKFDGSARDALIPTL